MGEKSANKKAFILETARDIFAKKGYCDTTMKDVVEACNISRGGVYLYFNNVKELFEAVMEYEAANAEDFANKIPEDASYVDVLNLFVKKQKKAILAKKESITIATYEYYFNNKVSSKNNQVKQEFDADLYVLEQLISEGIDAGEFYDIDPKRAASNMMYVIEGLKIAAKTRGITEAVVDEEINYVMQGIIPEE